MGKLTNNISLEAAGCELFSKRDCCNNSNYAVLCFQRVFWTNIARSLLTLKRNGGLECSTIKVLPRRQGSGKGALEHPCHVPTLPARKSPFQQECM